MASVFSPLEGNLPSGGLPLLFLLCLKAFCISFLSKRTFLMNIEQTPQEGHDFKAKPPDEVSSDLRDAYSKAKRIAMQPKPVIETPTPPGQTLGHENIAALLKITEEQDREILHPGQGQRSDNVQELRTEPQPEAPESDQQEAA
jgi:hypothetical protein